MRVAIRTDASMEIGTGHVMRCLALANKLRARGGVVLFVCRENPGHMCDVVESRGFSCRRLPPTRSDSDTTARWQADADQTIEAIQSAVGEVDLLVVDQYDLRESWEKRLRPLAKRIFVIDDLADRNHDCDVLLDQNLHDFPELRYVDRVPVDARVFVGPRYAMLRPEFDSIACERRASGVRRLLVFFGGVDPSNEATKVVRALRQLAGAAPPSWVVLGPTNPHSQEVREAAQDLPDIEVFDRTDKMAELMCRADLAVGTCGVAAWERCVVGLPTIVVVSAENQRDDARILQQLGAVRSLGDAGTISVEEWASAIRSMQADSLALERMSEAAASVMHDRATAVQELEAALVA